MVGICLDSGSVRSGSFGSDGSLGGDSIRLSSGVFLPKTVISTLSNDGDDRGGYKIPIGMLKQKKSSRDLRTGRKIPLGRLQSLPA